MVREVSFPDPPSADAAAKDPLLKVELEEHQAREGLVQLEKAKLLREELKECYVKKGVNSSYMCKEIAEQYLESIKDYRTFKVNHAG